MNVCAGDPLTDCFRCVVRQWYAHHKQRSREQSCLIFHYFFSLFLSSLRFPKCTTMVPGLAEELKQLLETHKDTHKDSPDEFVTAVKQLLAKAEDDYNSFPHPAHLPSTCSEIFSRYVFPEPHVESFTVPLPRDPANDLPSILGTHKSQTLHISYAPLNNIIGEHVASTIKGDLQYTSRPVRDFTRRYVHSYEPIMECPLPLEHDFNSVAIGVVGVPINCLLADPAIYKSGSGGMPGPFWEADRAGRGLGPTQWLCRLDNDVRAVMEWRIREELPSEALGSMVQFATAQDFSMTLEATGEIGSSATSEIDKDVQKFLFELWGKAHRHKCRWLLAFNVDVLMVCYLKDAEHLLVSDPIPRLAGLDCPAVTFATVLFGVALPDLPRPEGASGDINYYG